MRCFSASSVHAISMAEANQSVYFVQLTAVQTAAGFLLNILVECSNCSAVPAYHCSIVVCLTACVLVCCVPVWLWISVPVWVPVIQTVVAGCCHTCLTCTSACQLTGRKRDWYDDDCGRRWSDLRRLKWWWSFILTVVTNRIMVLMLSWCLWWHSLHLQKYISSDDQDAFHFV